MKLLLPYIQLARLDRPIGSWLLLLPCWWGLVAYMEQDWTRVLWLGFLFALGAVFMRGAGCTYNDLADHQFDKQVARTKTRPLPSGAVSRGAAIGFLFIQLIAGALVLFQFNQQTIILGIGSLILVVIYPFMKRITYMPQFFLGLAFSWGIVMGASASGGDVPLSALVLYLGSIFWVIGYDTIYALQDKEDDILLGLKSSAILFGDRVKVALGLLYGAAWLCFVGFGLMMTATLAFYVGLVFVGAHLAWQVLKLDVIDENAALKMFKANRDCGLLMLISLIANSISLTLSGF